MCQKGFTLATLGRWSGLHFLWGRFPVIVFPTLTGADTGLPPLDRCLCAFQQSPQDLKHYKEIQDSIAAEYPGYNREGYVFCQENGQPYEPRTYQDLFKRCVWQAGSEDTNFHALRHTFATRSLEQGMDVVTLSRLLGHANPSITMDKYGHALDDHKRASIGKLDGLYAGAKRKPSPKKGQER